VGLLISFTHGNYYPAVSSPTSQKEECQHVKEDNAERFSLSEEDDYAMFGFETSLNYFELDGGSWCDFLMVRVESVDKCSILVGDVRRGTGYRLDHVVKDLGTRI